MSKKDVAVAEQNLPAIPEDMWDENHPRSLVNLVPNRVAECMLELKANHSDYLRLDERDLFKRLQSEECEPSPTDNRLRLSFWDEYDKAQATNRQMSMTNVLTGICTGKLFYDYISRPEKAAWLLCRPASYKAYVEEALNFSSMRMRQILAIDPIGNDGRVNVKLAELQAKIHAMLELRAIGAVTQKVEQTQKNFNLNVSTSDKTVAGAMMARTEDEIDNRIKELARRERKALNLPDTQKEEALPGTCDVIDAETV
jgi:hypothetical protein